MNHSQVFMNELSHNLLTYSSEREIAYRYVAERTLTVNAPFCCQLLQTLCHDIYLIPTSAASFVC